MWLLPPKMNISGNNDYIFGNKAVKKKIYIPSLWSLFQMKKINGQDPKDVNKDRIP